MFTTLAAAAGIADVNAEVMDEKKQYIDGVNNLAYWKGEQARIPTATRSSTYYESILTAVRMGPWKLHFSTREDYYANLQPRVAAVVLQPADGPLRKL